MTAGRQPAAAGFETWAFITPLGVASSTVDSSMIIADHDSARCFGKCQLLPGIPAILRGFRQYLAAAGDLAMVPAVGPSNDKRSSSRASHGEWLVNVADDVVAPMTTLEVIDALRKGRLSEEALVWRIGMRNWTAVLDVPQLRLAASSRPPPPSVAPPAELAPVAAGIPAQQADPTEHEDSAEYLDSPEHFESVSDSELDESDEPVTTLMLDSSAAMLQSSLAPTTAEAVASSSARAPGAWGDIDELLSGERRAEQQHTRRVVLWAALGSAAMAAAFTLFVVRSPAPEAHRPAQAEQPSSAPELVTVPVPLPAATLEAPASASASASQQAPAAPRAAPKWGGKRPKRGAPITRTGDAPSEPTPAPSEAASAPIVAVVPGAAPEPAANASAAAPATPAKAGEAP